MTREASTRLLHAARGGSATAVNELYARYGGRLLAFIRLRLGRSLRSRLDSGDILQATLMKSFQRLDQFEGEDGTTLMGWLARIAENEIRDQVDYQHRARRDAAADVPITDAVDPAAHQSRSPLSRLIAEQDAARLTAALEGLEPDHREVIVLRKFEELTFPQIARRMGRSEDACRMLLARALVRLTLAMGVAP